MTTEEEQLEVQVRIPLQGDLGWLEPLLEELAEPLDDDGGEFVDDLEEEGDEIAYYLYGPDQDRLVTLARTAAAKFDLPPGGYTLKTAPDGAHERADL